jgi:hypothetical protein
MSELVKRAWYEILPSPCPPVLLEYSGRFSGHNARILYKKRFFEELLHLKLSKTWQDVDESIQIGLIQVMLGKLFAKKLIQKSTESMALYQTFMKKIESFAPTFTQDPLILEAFQRINARFFHDELAVPNLLWGSDSFRKFGSYTYQTDTIMLSTLLKSDQALLEYVLFHEMLHKKHKYYMSKTGKKMHHHTAFKTEENTYPNKELLEKRLSQLSRAYARSHW